MNAKVASIAAGKEKSAQKLCEAEKQAAEIRATNAQ
jgi:hypothetical protein